MTDFNVPITCSYYPDSCYYYNFIDVPSENTFNKVFFTQNFWILLAMFICFHIPFFNIFACILILIFLVYTNYLFYKDYKYFSTVWSDDTLKTQINMYYRDYGNNVVTTSPQYTGPARLTQY